MVLEEFLQLWSCWGSVKNWWDGWPLPGPINQEGNSLLLKWTWVWYICIHHKLMKSLCFWSRKAPDSSFSLAEKHSSKNILVRIPYRKFHASAQIKKASTFLFPLIERDSSEHWVLSWKADAGVLGIVRYWQMGMMFIIVDSEGVQMPTATWNCAAGSSCFCCQHRFGARKLLRFCTFRPDPRLFFGTTVHAGSSSLSQNCGSHQKWNWLVVSQRANFF